MLYYDTKYFRNQITLDLTNVITHVISFEHKKIRMCRILYCDKRPTLLDAKIVTNIVLVRCFLTKNT